MVMGLIQKIARKEFSLQYQASGYGPNGYVILPAGKYYVSSFRQSQVYDEVWVSIKQSFWDESIEISIGDLLKLQKYEYYS